MSMSSDIMISLNEQDDLGTIQVQHLENDCCPLAIIIEKDFVLFNASFTVICCCYYYQCCVTHFNKRGHDLALIKRKDSTTYTYAL